ncbi:MAG: beta-galactosidase trimerization domain-containing protein [Armatimonadetes bacterium]|nr:beta-galactosidase trimerization domain-containing protein [Armatimonadota bacterium]
MSYHLRFRQIHLDFHTSPDIPGIGEKFDTAQWQKALKEGHVNSITTFAKCHHGWSYHKTRVGKMHPGLSFDLLRQQYDAAKEIDVNVPIYISAGVDDVAAAEHPEWREVGVDGQYIGWAGPITRPGFKSMCFATPYLNYLCDQIREVVELFPECDGIFLDIIHQDECCCRWCLAKMEEMGLDAEKPEDRRACAEAVLENYYIRATAAVRSLNPQMPVFHNSGHVAKGRQGLLKHFSHLELESLPTGGWGYDHFPLSAKYAQKTGLDVLGMTGKFHTTWGEFGGYKHPNALLYECAAMLAHGAKCSVGDQLHPNGWMDETTYRIIGQAYEEVEAKEPWCDNVEAVADVAVLSSEAETGQRLPDTGAGRVLLEEHFLFDLIDRNVDFAGYRLLILPDVIRLDGALTQKLRRYLEGGGRLLLTGESGLGKDGGGFGVDIGASYEGLSPDQPDYLVAGERLKPDFVDSPLVMYGRSQQVRPTTGESLAAIRLPYFNRTWRHYCSHQHAPDAKDSVFSAAVQTTNTLYLAHPIFTIYAGSGAVAYRQYASSAICAALGAEPSLTTNMPSTARVSLMRQPDEKRYVLHLLYANTIARGSHQSFSAEGYVRDSHGVEVIEELLPLHDVDVTLRLPEAIQSVTLQPQGQKLETRAADGKLSVRLDKFTCHQMIELGY